MPELISPTSLKDLAAANAIRSATVVGDKGGYLVTIKYGGGERVIAARTREGQIKRRLFRSLNAASHYLRQIGVARYEVDETGYEELTDRPKRPDRSAALKHAHEAAAYDRWFRGEVARALKEADGSNTRWRTTEEVMASVDAKLASLKKKKRKAV
jgi:hypothetical protein